MFDEHFQSYACVGDSITCTVGGIDYRAVLVEDSDSHVDDADCYSKKHIAAWKANQWMFVGVELHASKNGVDLGYLGSLWGVECNFPSRRKTLTRTCWKSPTTCC